MGYPKLWTNEQRKWAEDRATLLVKFGIEGPVDVILRLLEQGEITRAKARESIRQVVADQGEPTLPMDKLNWSYK